MKLRDVYLLREAAGELPGQALAARKQAMASRQAQKSQSRQDLIAQRAAATQGGQVALRRPSAYQMDFGELVKDILASAPEGLTTPQIMQQIDARMNPGDPYSDQRVRANLAYKQKKGWNFMNFLRAAANNVDGKWRLK